MERELDRFPRVGDLIAVLGNWTLGDGPLYRKLADAMARATEDGALRAGQRRPSERELAKALAVSRSTVVAAYDELHTRDLLERRQGSGTRISRTARAARSDGRVSGGRGTATCQRLIDAARPVLSLASAPGGGAPGA